MFFGLTIFLFVFKKSIFKPINTDVTQSKPINKNKKLHRIRDQRHVVRITSDESQPWSSEFSWEDCCFRCDHSYKWYHLYGKGKNWLHLSRLDQHSKVNSCVENLQIHYNLCLLTKP